MTDFVMQAYFCYALAGIGVRFNWRYRCVWYEALAVTHSQLIDTTRREREREYMIIEKQPST